MWTSVSPCLRVAAVGLNLVCASHVFLLEPSINPVLEQQAVARCHRIGQTGTVYVTRLVIAGTIEQRILDARAPASARVNPPAGEPPTGASAGGGAGPGGSGATVAGGGVSGGAGVQQQQQQPAPAFGNERVHGERGADTGSLLARLFA
jgi:hypothetical protein